MLRTAQEDNMGQASNIALVFLRLMNPESRFSRRTTAIYLAVIAVLSVALLAVWWLDIGRPGEQGWTEAFEVDESALSTSGYNPYFLVQPGHYLVLEGSEDGQTVRLVITVLDDTVEVDGVETRVIEERESKGGELIEVSRNYFAFDENTSSVYYFGEEVDMYENGVIVNHEGAWRSGTNGSTFGMMMPGVPLLGAKYYQEMAPDVAMDRAEIISLSATVETSNGTLEGCLEIEETTPLEPGVKEYKYYSRGIGLVKDGSLVLIDYGY